MARLSKTLRRRVTERAGGYCEYCQAPQNILVELQVDHIVPLSAGGATKPDNLCLTCRHCNEYKSAYQTGIDPEDGSPTSLFHPRLQTWNEHFAWNDDFTRLVGLTPTGRATIERLRMNRPGVVQARILWLRAGWKPPTD